MFRENENLDWVHFVAGRAAQSEWKDNLLSIDYTTVLGAYIESQEDAEPVFTVCVEGTADSGHGYTYSLKSFYAIQKDKEGHPVVDDADPNRVEMYLSVYGRKREII